MTSIRLLICFFSFLFVSMGFPLQVIFDSKLPALIPYFLVLLLFLSHFRAEENVLDFFSVRLSLRSNIGLIIYLYIGLFVLNSIWQVLSNTITLFQLISSVVVYICPLTFYFYFRDYACMRQIRTCLYAILFSSVIIGLFFVYDSYMKLALEVVSDYSLKAFNYYLKNSNLTMEEANINRINIGSRSYGLLETHSISGAWVAIGGFAQLSLISAERLLLRRIVCGIYFLALVVCLNFTAIFSFLIITTFFEFRLFELFTSRVRKVLVSIVTLLLCVVIVYNMLLAIVGKNMAMQMEWLVNWQLRFLFGVGEGANRGIFIMFGETFGRYVQHIYDYPFVLLVGDGFSTFGFEKGGDVGFPGTFAMLGMPLVLLVSLSIITLFFKFIVILRQRNDGTLDLEKIGFSVYVVLLCALAEAHYSIWSSKAILPILFFSLAVYERSDNPQLKGDLA